jgi:hypothetical protein
MFDYLIHIQDCSLLIQLFFAIDRPTSEGQ